MKKWNEPLERIQRGKFHQTSNDVDCSVNEKDLTKAFITRIEILVK